jgi:hypothetical protein
MEEDRQGLAVSGGVGVAARYDVAVDQLLRMHPDTAATIEQLLTDFPTAPMAAALGALSALMGTDPRDRPSTVAILDAADDIQHLTARESAHLAAASAWVGGDMAAAGMVLDRLVVESPRDILALYVGHQIDFLSGNARNLRDRVGRVRDAYSPTDDAYGFVLGMAAFGVEECGDYRRAASLGLEAIERHPDDVWAIHAVAHCHEMQGDAGGGLAFLQGIADQWEANNGLAIHNHWHAALFDVELGRDAEVLARYDEWIRRDAPAATPFELLDGTALLWRLLLAGTDVGDRWTFAAEGWSAIGDEPYYAFNDMHAAMSFIGSGRLAEARALVARLEAWLDGGPPTSVTNGAMTARVGLPVCRGLVAFAEERYADSWAELLAVRPRLSAFGGSHAQRDVIDLTIIEAARRDGRQRLVDALTSERRLRRG